MTAIPVAPGELVDNTAVNEFARTHYRKLTSKQVVSSVTETDLLNGEITIDAGAMSDDHTLRLVAMVQTFNNNAATIALPRWRLKFGGTTLFDTGAPASGWAAQNSTNSWKIVAEITNLNATNAQNAMIEAIGGGAWAAADASFTTGPGKYGTAGSSSFLALAEGMATGFAVDTTIARALQLTVQLPSNSVNVWAQLNSAYVTIL